ncbi:hypothetical protein L1887_31732 [Cichorium endivia]|nr:hypothetical protein L1887_31732 [Cichorium endivia]
MMKKHIKYSKGLLIKGNARMADYEDPLLGDIKCGRVKMLRRLWGENYFDPKAKKWTTKSTGSTTCKRGFVQLCYEPIKQIINSSKNLLWPMLTKLGLSLTMKSEEKELMHKALMKCVMQKWHPAATVLLETKIFHLPSALHPKRLIKDPEECVRVTILDLSILSHR